MKILEQKKNTQKKRQTKKEKEYEFVCLVMARIRIVVSFMQRRLETRCGPFLHKEMLWRSRISEQEIYKCEFCTCKSSKITKTSSSVSVLSINRILKTRKKKKKMNAIEEDKVPELSRTCLGSRSQNYSSLLTTLMRHTRFLQKGVRVC